MNSNCAKVEDESGESDDGFDLTVQPGCTELPKLCQVAFED